MKIGIIGGSGLGEKLGLEQNGQTHDINTPFGKPSSPIITTHWHDTEIALLQRHGLGHIHPPSTVPYRANIFALKSLGITHILASGATGSLRENIAPGQLVVVDQIIDKTYRRPNTFYENAAVHVELAEPFCPIMRRWILAAAKQIKDVTVHGTGTYVCMEGPAFSTKAESNIHRQWAGDLIGMTVMPEARLAREAEIAYAMIAMPTDYDCWREHDSNASPQALLEEIIGNLNKAADANMRLMKAALADTNALEAEPSPAHSALALGIWSDKSKIDPKEVKRLRPLWGRYFS